jgi:hypothetical protein
MAGFLGISQLIVKPVGLLGSGNMMRVTTSSSGSAAGLAFLGLGSRDLPVLVKELELAVVKTIPRRHATWHHSF